jgi:hypothetical protein
MLTFKGFLREDKSNQAVGDLKSALLDRKEEIQSANKDDVYSMIDELMTKIAKDHNISSKELHDAWVSKYDEVPDSWVMNEAARKPSLRNPRDNPCWDGYKPVGTKTKNGKEVPNCVPEETELDEAEYQGREVSLGKPMKGDVKKSKVYVKDPQTGNVKKVNFGDPNMTIKKDNPARRRSFRARHNCDDPGPKTKARFWSCRAW